MDIADPHEHLYVRLMWVLAQWIAEEEHEIHLAVSDLGGYLGIPAFRA